MLIKKSIIFDLTKVMFKWHKKTIITASAGWRTKIAGAIARQIHVIQAIPAGPLKAPSETKHPTALTSASIPVDISRQFFRCVQQ